MIDEKLLDILVCPVSKAVLTYNQKTDELFCIESKLAYPVRDGIPVMLVSESRSLAKSEL